jgi:hypothetical protein
MRKTVLYSGIIFTLVAIRAAAWEKDLHYGLTKWLAYQAGFSLDDAETIAKGAEAPDEGKLYPAPGAVWHSACIGRDPDVSALVQEFHFPGYGPVPGPPVNRSVDPAGPPPHENAATDLVEKEVQAKLPSQPHEKTLTALGIALHPLEDSWSHQGEPDTPPLPCAKDLSWGHPAARNGWRKHDADLTYLHRQDTLDTAARVYDFLVRFLNNHPAMKRDSRRIPPVWNTVSPAVEQFARAASKADKRAWFQSQVDVPFRSYSDQTFLDKINLPANDKKTLALVPDTNGHRAYVLAAAQLYYPPRDVEAFVENVLTQWLIKRDVEGILHYTDVRQLRDAFMQQNEAIMKNTNPAEFSQLLFFMWLVRDHGLVNHLGHGLGEISGSEKRLNVTAQLDLLKKEPLIEINALRGTEMYFRLSRYPDSEDYAVIIEFSHAPRDACILTVGKSSSGAQQLVVKTMDWFTL